MVQAKKITPDSSKIFFEVVDAVVFKDLWSSFEESIKLSTYRLRSLLHRCHYYVYTCRLFTAQSDYLAYPCTLLDGCLCLLGNLGEGNRNSANLEDETYSFIIHNIMPVRAHCLRP